MKNKKGFTLLEIITAVTILGIITTFTVITYNEICRSWEVTTDYVDKLQRSDYALNQVVSALRSMYYPHDGKQDANYGFVLTDNGSGEDPKDSDVIEWSKTGSAIIGNRSAVADTVHRVQVMILEEGNNDYKDTISKTGLYARRCPDSALRPKDDDVDYTFANDEMYQPVMVVDGVVGFNCRVMKDAEKVKAENDESQFDDKWDESNSVPYKVELTFRIADPEGKSYRTNTQPIMRIVRIPVFEQSQDGARTPTEEDAQNKKDGGPVRGGATPINNSGGGNGGGGAAPGSGGGGTRPAGGGSGGGVAPNSGGGMRPPMSPPI